MLGMYFILLIIVLVYLIFVSILIMNHIITKNVLEQLLSFDKLCNFLDLQSVAILFFCIRTNPCNSYFQYLNIHHTSFDNFIRFHSRVYIYAYFSC